MPWAAWSKAIEKGYPQKEIAEASYQFQRATEAKEKITVGANEFVVEEDSPHILYIGEEVARQQTKKLNALRPVARTTKCAACLDALKKAAAQEPKAGERWADFSGEHHAVHHRRGEGLCHGRRNLRGTARGVRHVRGERVRVVSSKLAGVLPVIVPSCLFAIAARCHRAPAAAAITAVVQKEPITVGRFAFADLLQVMRSE